MTRDRVSNACACAVRATYPTLRSAHAQLSGRDSITRQLSVPHPLIGSSRIYPILRPLCSSTIAVAPRAGWYVRSRWDSGRFLTSLNLSCTTASGATLRAGSVRLLMRLKEEGSTTLNSDLFGELRQKWDASSEEQTAHLVDYLAR